MNELLGVLRRRVDLLGDTSYSVSVVRSNGAAAFIARIDAAR